MVRRQPRRLGRRGWILVAVAGAAALGLLFGVLIPAFNDTAAEERARAQARQDAIEAAERKRLVKEVQPRFADGPARRGSEPVLDYRLRLVTAGEAAILNDARARIAAGEFKAKARETVCEPYPATRTRAAQEADRDIPANRYECTVVSNRFALPEVNGRSRTGIIGLPYWLVVDYRSGKLTFCKISPKAGEGGKSLATVPVPEVCRDPLREPT